MAEIVVIGLCILSVVLCTWCGWIIYDIICIVTEKDATTFEKFIFSRSTDVGDTYTMQEEDNIPTSFKTISSVWEGMTKTTIFLDVDTKKKWQFAQTIQDDATLYTMTRI